MLITHEEMLRLPRPTPAQVKAFEKFLPGAHSWYKSSLMSGTAFVVFLNPYAERDWSKWTRIDNYKNLYGHLDFLWSFGEGFMGQGKDEAIHLPPELMQRCTFSLFPWGAGDGAALDVICEGYHENTYDDWTRLESSAVHPAREELLLLRRAYRDAQECWNDLSDDEREIACKCDSESDEAMQGNPKLLAWFQRDHTCYQIYHELNNQETAKVRRALQELQNWLDGK